MTLLCLLKYHCRWLMNHAKTKDIQTQQSEGNIRMVQTNQNVQGITTLLLRFLKLTRIHKNNWSL